MTWFSVSELAFIEHQNYTTNSQVVSIVKYLSYINLNIHQNQTKYNSYPNLYTFWRKTWDWLNLPSSKVYISLIFIFLNHTL